MHETRTDLLTPALIERFAATLDRPAEAHVPQGVHWCLCTPDAPTAALGADGHPRATTLPAPPEDLPRRMWAGSAVTFHEPLRAGASIERRSTVLESIDKNGRQGRLLFVTIGHEWRAGGVLAIEERQTLVYRAAANAAFPAVVTPPRAAEASWDWSRTLVPDAALLFRYSALTFNSHRIHYDAPYTRDVEHYPGLVVHGPLMATLLLDLVARELGPDRVARFTFRAVAPAIVGEELMLLGRRVGDETALCVRGADGRDHVVASAILR